MKNLVYKNLHNDTLRRNYALVSLGSLKLPRKLENSADLVYNSNFYCCYLGNSSGVSIWQLSFTSISNAA